MIISAVTNIRQNDNGRPGVEEQGVAKLEKKIEGKVGLRFSASKSMYSVKKNYLMAKSRFCVETFQ